MKYMTLILIPIVAMLSGCFNSDPPTNIAGEVVGCITADDDLYCVTKYADAGADDATEVLIGVVTLPRETGSFSEFTLDISYTDENDDEIYYTLLVESLRSPHERIVGYAGPGQFENAYIRVFSGDTVAVAITVPPTIKTPSKGYIIANLTRPEVEFDIPEEIDDVDVLDIIP